MNPAFAKIFSFFTSVIAPIILGYIIKTFLKVKKEKLDILLIINITIVLPISLSLIFWNIQLDKTMIMLPILGFITPLISGFFGFLFCKGKFDDPRQKGSYIISTMLSNCGTIGGLTMYIIYGEIGYAYVNLVILLAGINVFFIAYPLGTYFSNSTSSEKHTFKSIVFRKTNLPILGIVAGILLHIFANQRPSTISIMVDPLIKTMAWLSLIPVGASIDFKGFTKQLKKVLDISIIKFVIMPIITALLAFSLIPDKQMATTLVLINTMPVAINSVIISKLTKLDENVSIAAFLLTTTIYLFLVFPILSLIFI